MSVKPLIGTGNINNMYNGTVLIDKVYHGEILCYLRPSLKIEDFGLALEVAKSVFTFDGWEAIEEKYDYFYMAGYDSRQRDIFVYKVDHDVRTSTKVVPCTSWEDAKERVIWHTSNNMGGTWIGFDKAPGGMPSEDSEKYFVFATDSKYNEVIFDVYKSNGEVRQEY